MIMLKLKISVISEKSNISNIEVLDYSRPKLVRPYAANIEFTLSA